jgi:hypothetical protein
MLGRGNHHSRVSLGFRLISPAYMRVLLQKPRSVGDVPEVLDTMGHAPQYPNYDNGVNDGYSSRLFRSQVDEHS